ncbi:breast carcinoma amplified sequence 2 [Auriculariales sp. MPI-PUGE-AT-0066]|nr:breast carcinoma amplified sequence 2 [Auriculariales sp. MPI-PUGE-AT-0066]
MSDPSHDAYDALPYHDRDLELFPGLKSKVDAEFARERAKLPQPAPGTLHPRLGEPLTLFEKNSMLAAEMARVEAHKLLPPMDTTRYSLPAPESSDASEEEWQRSMDNAKAQLLHQQLRQSNLALLQAYGANAWRISNYLVEADAKAYEAALEQQREATTELNRERKNYQTRVGAQLGALETRWTELMSNLLQIEVANATTEGEILQLREREAQLAADLGSS